MDARKFIDLLVDDIVKNEKSFLENMEHLKQTDHTFCEWIEIFSTWMEWSTDECENMYPVGDKNG